VTGGSDDVRDPCLVRALDCVQGRGSVGEPGQDVQLDPRNPVQATGFHGLQGESNALRFTPVSTGIPDFQKPENHLPQNIVGLGLPAEDVQLPLFQALRVHVHGHDVVLRRVVEYIDARVFSFEQELGKLGPDGQPCGGITPEHAGGSWRVAVRAAWSIAAVAVNTSPSEGLGLRGHLPYSGSDLLLDRGVGLESP
jgi:hypothetical protein